MDGVTVETENGLREVRFGVVVGCDCDSDYGPVDHPGAERCVAKLSDGGDTQPLAVVKLMSEEEAAFIAAYGKRIEKVETWVWRLEGLVLARPNLGGTVFASVVFAVLIDILAEFKALNEVQQDLIPVKVPGRYYARVWEAARWVPLWYDVVDDALASIGRDLPSDLTPTCTVASLAYSLVDLRAFVVDGQETVLDAERLAFLRRQQIVLATHLAGDYPIDLFAFCRDFAKALDVEEYAQICATVGLAFPLEELATVEISGRALGLLNAKPKPGACVARAMRSLGFVIPEVRYGRDELVALCNLLGCPIVLVVDRKNMAAEWVRYMPNGVFPLCRPHVHRMFNRVLVLTCEADGRCLVHCKEARWAGRAWLLRRCVIRMFTDAGFSIGLEATEEQREKRRLRKKLKREARAEAQPHSVEREIANLAGRVEKRLAVKQPEDPRRIVDDLRAAAKHVAEPKYYAKGYARTSGSIVQAPGFVKQSSPKRMRADNFGAANFSAGSFPTHLPREALLAVITGKKVPCSTPQECLDMMQSVVEDRALHPPRFANQTKVMKITARQSFPLSGMTAGALIVFACPVLEAWKGIIVWQYTGGVWTALGAISQDRDPETGTTKCNSLYSSMRITAPLVVAATGIIQSQLFGEFGVVSGGPRQIMQGKMQMLAENRDAPLKLLTNETERMDVFLADVSPETVIRYSAADPPGVWVNGSNNQLVIYPSPAPSALNSYVCVHTGTDANSSTCSGWLYNLAASNVLTGTNIVFDSSLDALDTRMDKFGDMAIDVALQLSAVPNATGIDVTVTVIATDGTTVVWKFSQTYDTVNPQTIQCKLNTRGASAWAPNRGKIIQKVQVAIAGSVTLGSYSGYSNTSFVRIDYLNVSADSRWMVAALAGCNSNMQVTAEMVSHVETHIDQAAKVNQFVDVDNDPPYDEAMLKAMVCLVSAHQYKAGGPMSAGSFGDAIKDAGRWLWQNGLGNIAKGGMDMLSRKANAAMMGACDYPMAAGFDHDVTHAQSGFCFPAVYADAQAVTYEVVNVLRGDGLCPSFVPQITNVHLTCLKNFVGRSCELAFLCAALEANGVRVPKGCYTGEIDEVNVHNTGDGRVVEFILQPVAAAMEKIGSVPRLCGFFAGGFWANGSWDNQPTVLARALGAVDVEEMTTARYGFPRPGWRFIVPIWPKARMMN